MTIAQAKVPLPGREQKIPLDINGFTPKVVAELAEISISGAYRILAGERMPGSNMLAKLAEVVGMDMGELHKELLSRAA